MDKETTTETAKLMIDWANDRCGVQKVARGYGVVWGDVGPGEIWDCAEYEYRRKPKPQELFRFRLNDDGKLYGLYGSKEEALRCNSAEGKPVRFIEAEDA